MNDFTVKVVKECDTDREGDRERKREREREREREKVAHCVDIHYL